MTIQDILRGTGNQVGTISSQLISYLSNQNPSKIIAALIFSIVAYIIVIAIQKPLKWLIIILLVFLAISTVFSIFT